jgi:hypothetical protein
LLRSTCRARNRLPGQNRLEIVVSDGIFVFLAEKPLFDQNVEAWRRGVRVLGAEQPQRADVLETAEDQFVFLLALRCLFPDRHRDGHHDRRDAHGNQEHRHRVAGVVLTL